VIKIKKRDGYILPAVILFIIFSVAMGMALLELGVIENKQAMRRGDREKAFYLAEAGIEKAIAMLRVGPDHPFLHDYDESNPYPLGSGEIILEYDPTENTITSTGRFGPEHNEVEEKIKIYFSMSGAGTLFPYGIYGSYMIDLRGNVNVYGYDSRDGSVHDSFVGSISEIKLTGNARIYGDAGVSPSGTISGIDGVMGTPHYDLEPLVLDPVEVPSLPNTSQGILGGHRIDGNYNFSVGGNSDATIFSGDYKFNDFSLSGSADLEIDGNVRLHVEGDFEMKGNNLLALSSGSSLELYLSGGMTIGGNARINPSGNPTDVGIYSDSDKPISLAGNSPTNAGIYAPDADVTFSGNTPLRGNVITNGCVRADGNITIYQDVALSQVALPGTPDEGRDSISIDRWTKPSWSSHFESAAPD